MGPGVGEHGAERGALRGFCHFLEKREEKGPTDWAYGTRSCLDANSLESLAEVILKPFYSNDHSNMQTYLFSSEPIPLG